jgi:molecular chaperone GrpE
MTEKKIQDQSVPAAGAGSAGSGGGGQPVPSATPQPDAFADVQEKYLRLAAEFDNYRKRVAKERSELWGKAQADLVGRLVDALDDLARFVQVDPLETDPKTLHDGVDMVQRKVWKQLDTAGVQRIDETGVPFDPTVHEAVTTTAAPSPQEDRTVGSVLQPGYRLGDVLIRPARVAVQLWTDAGEPAS